MKAEAFLPLSAHVLMPSLYTKLSLKLQKLILRNYSWENATLSPDYLQQKSDLKDAGK